MKKRILAAVLASASILGAVAGCSSNNATSSTASSSDATSSATDSSKTEESKTEDSKTEDSKTETSDKFTLKEGEGKTLNIAVWNEEFKNYFEKYLQDKMPEGVTVNFKITENKDNAYQNKLDEDLPKNEAASADDKIDMFLFEADYALKYVNSEYTLDVKSLGLTDEDLSGMYQYTKDVCTTQDDAKLLKGVSWQATPGLYAYRRSIAKDVLGTDDPAKVQEALADWTKFDEVAAKAADKGYKMLSGYDDAYRTFSNNVSAPWVNDNNEIIIDDNIMKWVDQTKTYTDKGYNNKTSLWSDAWAADQGPDGKVFGFFYSTWGINFTLAGNSLAVKEADGGKLEVGNGGYGDWAVCYGPQAYFWGGSWLAAAKGTDNATLVGDIMRAFCCNKDFGVQFTKDTQDYYNNEAAMKELAASDFKSAFLGGQNHIALFVETAPKIDMSKISIYDQGLNETFQAKFKEYFDGTVDKDTALKNFYEAAIVKYPELKKPADA